MDLVQRMMELISRTGNDAESVAMNDEIKQTLEGATRVLLVQAIQGVAGCVEDAVALVVAVPKAAHATAEGICAPHLAIIK